MKVTKVPRLTLKTAKAIVSQELGISTATLKREPCAHPESYVYVMQMGNIEISVENDCYNRTNLFILLLRTDSGSGTGKIRMLFNSDTLARDYEEEWKRYVKEHKVDFEDEVCSIGIEGCQKVIDHHYYNTH